MDRCASKIRSRKSVRASQPVEPLEDRRLMSANWFVATNGSDNNPGTLAAPFATVQHAATLAQAGDTVFIRGGTYRETVTPAHSGTAGAPITFTAYNGESVEIDGADPITRWNAGPAYAAPMAWDLGEGNNQVFVDGKMMTEARWPNTSLDVSHPKLESAKSATTGATSTTIFDPALTQAAGYWDGAIIHFAPGQRWVAYTATVTDSGPGYLTMNWTPPDTYEAAGAGTQYYLTGKFQALDAPGEWYRDPTDGQLHLWTATNDNPANHLVEAKHRLYAFDLSGDSYVTVRGINVFAATINTDKNSSNVVLDHLNAEYLSQFVVQTSGWTQPNNAGIALNGSNDLLENSEIGFSAGDGVVVNGSNDRVTNNEIHDVAYNGGDSAGIRLNGSYAWLDHNTVWNAGRNGIDEFGWDAHIENNVLHDLMLQTTDGGGIYTVRTDGTGGEIAYNRVYNVAGGGYGGTGIFLDDNSSNWTVDHNLTYNVTNALKLNYSSKGERIYNNTLDATGFSLTKNYGPQDWTGASLRNNVFTRTVQTGTGATVQNNLMPGTNPLFANWAGRDYTLLASSPAVDAGQVISPYTNGYAGAMPDEGAFEFGRPAFTSGASLSNIPTLPPQTPASVGSPPPVGTPQIGPLATSVIQAEDYDNAKGIGEQYLGIAYCDNGDWAEYNHVNFGAGVTSIQMNVAVVAGYAGQQMQVHLDAVNGPLIGTLVTRPTPAWNSYTIQTTAVTKTTGVHDLYITFVGSYGIGNIDWFKFS